MFFRSEQVKEIERPVLLAPLDKVYSLRSPSYCKGNNQIQSPVSVG